MAGLLSALAGSAGAAMMAFTFLLVAGGVALLLAPSEAVRLARRRIEAVQTTPAEAVEAEELARPLSQRLLGPLLLRLRTALYARTPRGMREAIEARLTAAGRPADVGGLLVRKAGLAVAAGGLLWLVLGPHGPAARVLGGAFGTFAGWRLPEFGLERDITRRRQAIARVLPDALDLLCTSVEAGLGLDGALQKVAEKMAGPLADELATYLRDVRLGRPRENALRDLAGRAGVPELRTVIAAILQSERLGASLARVLRVQAQDLRHRRRIAARERAMRIPILLLFPLVGFIFPALFTVILGPAALKIFHAFGRH
jgi:tight adherence protein C